MAVRHYTLKVTVYEGDVSDELESISEKEISELASELRPHQMKKLLKQKGRTVTGISAWTSNYDRLKSWIESNKGSGVRQVTHNTSIPVAF